MNAPKKQQEGTIARLNSATMIALIEECAMRGESVNAFRDMLEPIAQLLLLSLYDGISL